MGGISKVDPGIRVGSIVEADVSDIPITVPAGI